MTYRKIGTIVQASGFNGQVVLAHEGFPGTSLQALEHIFIEHHQGSYIPYFPEGVPVLISEGKTTWQLEDVTTLEEAKALIKKDVYIEASVFAAVFSGHAPLAGDLAGFKITDRASGHSAVILSVSDAPGQLLAHVLFQGKELILPLAEDLILSVHQQSKVIEMHLPEGIWEI